MAKQWWRWLPSPKYGVARGVAVFGSKGFARDVAGLNELLGRWPALSSWAEARGFALSGVPEDLQQLDQEIGEQDRDLVTTALANEAGLFLGTVIINSAAGARWRVWPNGHPVVLTASGRELDVVAMANRRFMTGRPRLADVYSDAVNGGNV
ncbi:MAG TPA: DUF6278 family protein [Streptosporangiaceae bacterium]|nr:DUF6278 family protein [Streptosporangiaceae bacterium]